MHINDFFAAYKNHPVLFIGTGFSLRYLINSYSWDELLKQVIVELYGNKEYYYDIKSTCEEHGKYRYDKIGSIVQSKFNDFCEKNRNEKFKEINDVFYKKMEEGINLSRFKIFISSLLKDLCYREDKKNEVEELIKIRKNIASIVTTNYDLLIEDIFKFNPLIGNNILLSNPYGSVYKIHGCVNEPSKIIISTEDYNKFNRSYELIRAQLLSLFIHHPIIFIGYNIGDDNIKNILKTIFTCVEVNSPEANKVRENFLLIEYEKDSTNKDVTDHDIDIQGFSTIRINKLKTDDFTSIYKGLSTLKLPVSIMDIRRVESVFHEIRTGGDIKVHITEDLDSLPNNQKILVIGSQNTIKFEYMSPTEIIGNYFNIIDESKSGILTLIGKQKITSSRYFPIFGFYKINPDINDAQRLKTQQIEKIILCIEHMLDICKNTHPTINDIINDDNIAPSNKPSAIIWSIYHNTMELNEVEKYLREYKEQKNTSYNKILCVFDYKKYGEDRII